MFTFLVTQSLKHRLFVLAFAAALSITLLIELVRWLNKKRTKAAAERTAV